MDILILILVIAAFIGLLVLIPLLIIILIARINSANISLKQSWKLYLRKSARKPVFQALAIEQKNSLGISLEQIETHWFAGGDPVKLMNILANNSDNSEITFQNLSAINLAGKDLEKAITSGQKIFEIDIKDFPVNSFRLDYHANYKLGLYSVFGDSDPADLEQKIIKKLKSFSSTWDSDDPINTQNFLRTNILNTEYWERILNAQLVNQTVQIKI